MTTIDIYSGFLGAGKTTLIKKLIAEAYCGEKLVLIENEFGEIGIDGGFLQDAGINITEMNSGCICCSLVGDFGKALNEVIAQYDPDRIVIEPSGVGKLSDVVAAVEKVTNDNVKLGHTVAVVDAGKVKSYMKNFGEFYNNQIETAAAIVMSRTDGISNEKLEASVALIREHNADAILVTTPWNAISGKQLLQTMDEAMSLGSWIAQVEEDHHEHHHHDHDEECCCGHHHHEHHHHDHDEECCCGHHHEHHHHDHDEECCCGHHHGEHHHHDHHADEVFTSWGVETTKKFTAEKVNAALAALDSGDYGMILRAKGILAAEDGNWIHFDYVPEEMNVRTGSADVIGKLCVIGCKLDESGIRQLFGA